VLGRPAMAQPLEGVRDGDLVPDNQLASERRGLARAGHNRAELGRAPDRYLEWAVLSTAFARYAAWFPCEGNRLTHKMPSSFRSTWLKLGSIAAA
jgi:hypothetical protein